MTGELHGLRGLRRIATPAAATAPASPGLQQPPVERCEMCAEQIPGEHGHVADLEGRRLLCACRSCYLLFTGEGAGGGRYRSVPDRVERLPDFAMTAAQWDSLQIPVDLAFLLHQSTDDRTVAAYPGPGGATESELDLSSWSDVVAANDALRDVADDVEAVLLRRDGTEVEAFITPIDACYQLVGLVRRYWVGFAGGEEVWRRIDAFFDGLRDRSRPPVRAHHGPGEGG